MDNNKSGIVFDPETHTYYVNGKRLPSVTQLISHLMTFYVSEERRENLAEEGTANHAAVEDMIRTGVSSCGYTDAVKKFMEDYKDQIGGVVECEIPLASSRGFAGKPDVIFERAIVDLKRSMGNKKIHALQTIGYELLAVENGLIKPTKQHLILIAHDDGGYDVTNVYNSMAETVFLSLLQRYKIDQLTNYYMTKI